MNQQDRCRWLIRALLEEMPQYESPVFPFTQDRQWRLLRSLMNVRPPMPPASMRQSKIAKIRFIRQSSTMMLRPAFRGFSAG